VANGAVAERTVIPLPANFDRQGIASLQETVSSVDVSNELVLDASPVTRVGTMAIQFLIVLLQSMSSQRRAVFVESPSPALREAIADLGLAFHFKAWMRP
jgi:anti-anti-sigma regulatory factor